jgi:hypothetical protein
VARTGARALQVGIADPVHNRYSYSSAEQRFSVPIGRRAALTLWVYVADGGGRGDYGYLLIRPDSGSWRILRILHERTAGWTQVAADVSHYAGSAFTLRIGMRNDGPGDGAAAVMYADSLSVGACTP